MLVRKLDKQNISAVEVPGQFVENGIKYHELTEANWSDRFPYKPKVEFAIAHDGSNIYLHYKVKEDSVRAVEGMDMGHVWEDSCCEFFFLPEGSPRYYNLEVNCIGTVLFCFGEGREGRLPSSDMILGQIDRWASLGNRSFGIKNEDTDWQLTLKIPSAVLRHNPELRFSGCKMKANFYKCGDKTQNPHFLSWQKVGVPNPDFHRPEFFGELEFE